MNESDHVLREVYLAGRRKHLHKVGLVETPNTLHRQQRHRDESGGRRSWMIGTSNKHYFVNNSVQLTFHLPVLAANNVQECYQQTGRRHTPKVCIKSNGPQKNRPKQCVQVKVLEPSFRHLQFRHKFVRFALECVFAIAKALSYRGRDVFLKENHKIAEHDDGNNEVDEYKIDQRK